MRHVACVLLVFAAAVTACGGDDSARFDPWLGAPFEVRERPAIGSDLAPVTIVEVSSYTCAHCRAFHKRVFPALRDRYIASGRVRWVMISATAEWAGEEAEVFRVGRCLGRLGQYAAAVDFLFASGSPPSEFLDRLVATHPAVSLAALNACLQTPSVRGEVAADFAEYRRLGIKETPAFFIRMAGPQGRRVAVRLDGYQTLDYFERVLDELLKSP